MHLQQPQQTLQTKVDATIALDIALDRNLCRKVQVGDLIGSVRCAEMPDGSKEELKSTWEVWLKESIEVGVTLT